MSVRDQRVGTSYSDKVTEEEDDTKRKPNSKSQCRTPMGIPILMQIGRPVLEVAGVKASHKRVWGGHVGRCIEHPPNSSHQFRTDGCGSAGRVSPTHNHL